MVLAEFLSAFSEMLDEGVWVNVNRVILGT